MRILVTGSSGHLGEAIIRSLQSKNIDCVGIDLTPSRFTTHVGSIVDSTFVKKAMEGIDAVIHTATLHKPHVVTHSHQDFIDTNITGTLNLLQEAVKQSVKAFVYTSTTSTFGDVLTPKKGEPAIWTTEETKAIPKNIYGVTKKAAEDLCQLFYRNRQLPCIVLKTSRFFPEEDDKETIRLQFTNDNMKMNELLYRRVDIQDAVDAHLLAVEKAKEIGFGNYIISATSPFSEEDSYGLRNNALSVVAELFPDYEEIYQKKDWKMLSQIDRIYVNKKAGEALGWQPKYDFRFALDQLKSNKDFKSELANSIGSKGYHAEVFENGPYPVKE